MQIFSKEKSGADVSKDISEADLLRKIRCIEKYICQDVNCKLISKRNLAAAVLVIKPSSKKVTKNS